MNYKQACGLTQANGCSDCMGWYRQCVCGYVHVHNGSIDKGYVMIDNETRLKKLEEK